MTITIAEAIDTLEEIKQLTAIGDNGRDRRALSLGIEALKRERKRRDEDPLNRPPDLLPGETDQ